MKNQTFRQRLGKSVAGIAARISNSRIIMQPMSSGYTGVPSRSKRLRGWQMGSGSSAAETLPDLPELRSASSDMVRNSPLAAGTMHTNVSGVIGTGLHFRPALNRDLLGLDRDQAQAKGQEIVRELNLAFKTLSWEGNVPWFDLQDLILRGVLEKGDLGIVRRYDQRPGEVYGTKVVLVEAERISNPSGKPDSERIKAGVQFSSDGRVEGYHFTRFHPGDIAKVEDRRWEYVPAVGDTGLPLMLLPMVHLRPGQPRGIPYLAPIMELAKILSDYTLYE
ncbi:phage portal protein, partial [Maritalea sp.]|uniref:phage portal protein n=1 Tax=Maritalea sp. TaxID=2003361 RepID=UPI0039E370C3